MNNHWWENVYNKAATNLNVATNESNEVKMRLNSEQSVEVSFWFCEFVRRTEYFMRCAFDV